MPEVLYLLLIPVTALAWYSRRWAVLVLLASLSAYVVRWNIWGIPTTWLELGIYLVTLVSLSKGDWRVWLKLDQKKLLSWAVPLIIWLVAGIIGILVASDVKLALGVWKGFIFDPLLLSLLVATIYLKNSQDDKFTRNILLALMLGAVVTTLLAMCQSWLTGAGRLQSGYDSPNVLAMYLSPILVATALYYSKNHNQIVKRQKIIWLTGLLVIGLGVVLTDSYTAMLAVIGALIISAIIYYRSQWAVAMGVVMIVLSLLMPWLSVTSSKNLLIGHTNETYGITSGEVRLILWRQAIDFIKERPWFGLGLGQWQGEFTLVAREAGWLSIKNAGLAIELHHSSLYPHNLWLTTWLAAGLIGLIALLWLVIRVFKQVLTTRSAVILAGALSVQIIHGTLDTPLWKNDLAVLWWLPIIMAIIMEQKDLFSSDNQHVN